MKGVGEERKSHYHLHKVDGCHFRWNDEKKRLIPRRVRSRFFHVDFGVAIQVTSSYPLPFLGRKGITTRDFKEYVKETAFSFFRLYLKKSINSPLFVSFYYITRLDVCIPESKILPSLCPRYTFYLKNLPASRAHSLRAQLVSLASLSAPMARDLIVALRARSCALRIHLSLFLII